MTAATFAAVALALKVIENVPSPGCDAVPMNVAPLLSETFSPRPLLSAKSSVPLPANASSVLAPPWRASVRTAPP